VSVSLSSSLQIHHECPQCGGPVRLDETDRLFLCNFCRVRLYISSAGYFRYYIATEGPGEDGTLLVPYWRMRGLCFRRQSLSIRSKILDASLLAADIAGMPRSLGLRTQALTLRFATSATPGQFLKPQIPFSRFHPELNEVLQSLNVDTGSPVDETFIGEAVSLIYAPFYIRDNTIYDAILKRPVAPSRGEICTAGDPSHEWDIMFRPALCPECGWDLDGAKNSTALLCRNCDSVWSAGQAEFVKTPFKILPSTNNNACYLPFWEMRATVEGLDAASYADLVRLANLPKAIQKEWHEKELAFWCPAFIARPGVFLRLSTQLTILQPPVEEADRLPAGNLLPVTLSDREAYESINVTLAQLAVPKNRYFPILKEVKILPETAGLVYIPFTERGSEFIQPRMNFSIPKNTFRDI